MIRPLASMSLLRAFLAGLFLLAAQALPAQAATKASVEAQFRAWLDSDLWPEAQRNGVSRQSFEASLGKVRLNWDLPDLAPPGFPKPKQQSQSQAEFKSPGSYFSQKRLQGLAATGRTLAARHKSTLAAIERRYGVPGAIVLAVWGRESGYGGAKLPYPVFEVLATKAFMATRRDLFRKELLAALTIVERGHIAPSKMMGSWAGAMGQPQFLPSSFLAQAVDFDGDGAADIWSSVPDSLASIANYLAQRGWQRGREWGFEARIPQGMTCALEGPDRARRIGDLARAGIARVSGKPFPERERDQPGMVLVPAGIYGPQFVVTPNFYVIKEYNNSDLYALFIGNLADRIAHGSGDFATPWQDRGTMLRSDVAKIQKALEARGYDVGGSDGLPGYKTRRSIGEWQEKAGLATTCYPEPALLKALK